jgi:hypothetical protein
MKFSINDLRRLHHDGPMKGLPLKRVKAENRFYYVEVDPWVTTNVLREMERCWEALMIARTTGTRSCERVLFCATGSVHFPITRGYALKVDRALGYGNFHSAPFQFDATFTPIVPSLVTIDIMEAAGVEDILGINQRPTDKSWMVEDDIDLMFETEHDRTLFTLAM